MKTFLLLSLCFSAALGAAAPVFGLGVGAGVGAITLSGGGAALAVAGKALVGGALLGGLLAGGKRGKREAAGDQDAITRQHMEALFLAASRLDADDCAKKYVCIVNALPKEQLESDEPMMVEAFGSCDAIDVHSTSTVLFDLAAKIGRAAGEEQCNLVYNRCAGGIRELRNNV